MRVAIIGANGQLGTDLVAEFRARGHEVSGLTHADINVEDASSVDSAVDRAAPDVIVNTAAYHVTANCEKHPDRAFSVNAIGALNVSRTAARRGAACVYVSTDYVFDGEKRAPYLESDRPSPLNVYGASKLAGEHLTLANTERSAVVRVSGLYGRTPCRAKGDNFVTKMLRAAETQAEVRVVTDEVLTPTPTTEAARAIVEIVGAGGTGIFHATCEGECSWYEFAKEIFALRGIRTPLVPASVRDFPAGVRRPQYSVLKNLRLHESGLPSFPGWREAYRAWAAVTAR